jgi:hypothetical protein
MQSPEYQRYLESVTRPVTEQIHSRFFLVLPRNTLRLVGMVLVLCNRLLAERQS